MVTGGRKNSERRVFEFDLELVIGNRTHGCLPAEEQAWDEKSEDRIPGTTAKKETQAQLFSEANFTSQPAPPLPRQPVCSSGLAGWSRRQVVLFVYYLNRLLSRGHRLLRNLAMGAKWSERLSKRCTCVSLAVSAISLCFPESLLLSNDDALRTLD